MIATRTADGDSAGVSGCDAQIVEREVVQRAIINSAVRRGPPGWSNSSLFVPM